MVRRRRTIPASLLKKQFAVQEKKIFLHGSKALGRVLPPGGGKIHCDPKIPRTCASGF